MAQLLSCMDDLANLWRDQHKASTRSQAQGVGGGVERSSGPQNDRRNEGINPRKRERENEGERGRERAIDSQTGGQTEREREGERERERERER